MYQELHPRFLEAMDRLEALAHATGGMDDLGESEEGRQWIRQAMEHAPVHLKDLSESRLHGQP
jgi:hypothetical protein